MYDHKSLTTRTDRQTDGQTEKQLTTAVPRYALYVHASRGKNNVRQYKTILNILSYITYLFNQFYRK